MVNQPIYDEIDLREYIEVLLKRWKLVATLTIGLALAAFIFSSLQKPVYEAKTTILIRSENSGGGSLSQLSSLAGMAGITLPAGNGNLADLSKILQSKAVAAKVLDDLKLRERIGGWDDPKLTDLQLAGAVQGMLKKPKDNGNLIELKIEYSDPALAAEIANGFAGALSYYWNKLNCTEARKKREYIESQLPRVEEELKIAEQKLKQFTLLSLGGSGVASSGMLGIVSAQSQGVEVSRLGREFDITNSVYTMLRKEYETVKLEESKEISPFSLIDKAEKPLTKSRPKVKRNVMIGLVLGFFSGVFIAFFHEYWEKSAMK